MEEQKDNEVSMERIESFYNNMVTDSMLYWYPQLPASFDMPKTVFYMNNGVERQYFYDLMNKGLSQVTINAIDELIKESIGYPCFFRWDAASNKHEYDEACVIRNKDEINRKVLNTLEFNLMMELEPMAMVFREFLPADSPFKAFNGFPVKREYRVFYDKGVKCVHRYWMRDIFLQDEYAKQTIPKDWESKWDKLYENSKEDGLYLKELVNKYFPKNNLYEKAWSMDFMYAYGKWYLIDMAVALNSFHPKHSEDYIL